MGNRSSKRRDGKREPNGRLSRRPDNVISRALEGLDADQRDALSVGLEARQRVHGITQEMLDAIPREKDEPKLTVAGVIRDLLAGSFIGRLCMQRAISRQQYEAAMLWLEDCRNYAIAVGSPRQPGAVDLNRVQGGSLNGENVARNVRAMERYAGKMDSDGKRRGGAVGAIKEAGRAGAHFSALALIVQHDAEAYALLGDCREALNILARWYGLAAGRKAA